MRLSKFWSDVVSPPEEALASSVVRETAKQRAVLKSLNDKLRDLCRDTMEHQGDADELGT